MKLLRTSTMALASAALLTVWCVAPTSVSAAPHAESDQLTVQETSNSTEFTYGHSRTFILASSQSNGLNTHKATIDVNGKTFTAKRETKPGTVKWGGGGRTLDPADVSALKAMARDLHETYLADAVGRPDISEDTELLIRFVLLLADAPPGVKLKDYVVTAPVMREMPAQEEPASAPAASEKECIAETARASLTGEAGIAAAAACQQADEDGILYMSCTRMNRSLWHDSNGHCFLRESVNSGPGSSGSLGECGSGITGIGTYTYDCGEHDRCGRVHGGSLNPWDAECGDEYFEADDDYLWAPISRC